MILREFFGLTFAVAALLSSLSNRSPTHSAGQQPHTVSSNQAVIESLRTQHFRFSRSPMHGIRLAQSSQTAEATPNHSQTEDNKQSPKATSGDSSVQNRAGNTIACAELRQSPTWTPAQLIAITAHSSSAFGLDVTVNRFDGGHYQIGELFSIRVASEKDGFLYLFHLDSDEKLTLLYPMPGQDNCIHSGTSQVVPGPRDRFAFRVIGPSGPSRVRAIVTLIPLKLRTTKLGGREMLLQRDSVRRSSLPARSSSPKQNRSVEQVALSHQRQVSLDQANLVHKSRRSIGAFAMDEVVYHVDTPKGADRKSVPNRSQPDSVPRE